MSQQDHPRGPSISYRTDWTKGRRHGSYTTRSLTSYHEHIRSVSDSAITMMLDTSVEWPFGTYAEVIATKGYGKEARMK